MATISKLDELVGEALLNATRLHLDSMILCKNGSYASAQQLAVQASQEITKTIVLEQFLSQAVTSNENDQHNLVERAFIETFFSQRTLERHVAKAVRYISKQNEYKELTQFFEKVVRQTNEEELKKMTYVSLTKKDRKTDPNGKKVTPRHIARKDKTRRHITTNNDFLLVYIAGYVYDIYPVASEALAWELSEDSLVILQLEWPQVSHKAAKLLRDFAKKAYSTGTPSQPTHETSRATHSSHVYAIQNSASR